ncbi:MAG: hypothetical protein GY873_36360 [Bosea sp.]|uniref:hypothetical protein n=1 Tax=Bosea sp. (in: a-proteobacteria) TaxID=1871050 RepID=UPI002390B75F|nr:hypothetical protein [Bosea sp. (in: a-proteobacteria)]MCP4739676.1 hypothetical protein [Bosea sp. (in: a-proteobacteria)]
MSALVALRTMPLALVLLGGPTQSALAGEVRFRIDGHWISNQIEPQQASSAVLMRIWLTLKDGKALHERVERRQGTRTMDLALALRETEFGKENGRRGPVVWKVVNDTTLVRLNGWPSHTFAIWVRTNGGTSCTATLEWRLKPGFTAYEGWDRRLKAPIRYSEPSAPGATCVVL